MPSNKKIILFSLFALVFFGIFSFFYNTNKNAEVVLGNKTIKVEISDTDFLRSRGLSGHVPLKDDEGMLFIFNKPDLQGFWMKDMKFPIDIIWIDENLKITHIEKNLSPETYPRIYYPESPSLYVLEISAGEADSLGLKVADQTKFNIK